MLREGSVSVLTLATRLFYLHALVVTMLYFQSRDIFIGKVVSS